MVERIRTLLETRQLTPTQFADVIGIARPIVSHILSGRNKPSLEVVQRILAAMPELSMPWLLNGTGPMYAAGAAAQPTPAPQPTPPEQPAPVSAPPVPQMPAREPNALSRPPLASPAAEMATQSLNQYSYSALQPVATPPVPPVTRTVSSPRPMPRRFVTSAPKPTGTTSPETSAPAPVADPTLVVEPAPEVPTAAPVATQQPTATISEPIEQRIPAATTPTPAPATSNEQQPTADSVAAALFAGTEKPIRRIVIFYRDGSFADYQPE
ncbi:helix-turn-helix domain-containing protein [Hymenobacter terrenus]|uniref:helix-turn-helix domain-containing protein n=1 Tax=Hymenobacter terrenus TaxID=1629124 RepID=UPI0009082356|nr:helix-turn-helix transcriptional regulator [Hymenobacter terrenus]